MSILDSTSKYLNDSYDRGYIALSKLTVFKKDEKAYMAGNAIGILVLLVTLMLSALLFGTLQGQTNPKIDALSDANATASYNNIKSSGWSSIDLFGMVPYVAVFIVILGMLMGLTRDS
ncbi:MAG: hypothetical protein Q8910_02470 [Bacteroidota bacterium]|nr:hypothetical protein [Bacteroidota bacterium]